MNFAVAVFYRVYDGEIEGPGGVRSGHEGSWLAMFPPVTKGEAVEGFALPPWNRAIYIQQVRVPADTPLNVGIAGPKPEWGHMGGLMQFELTTRIDPRNFRNDIPFTDFMFHGN